MPDKNPYEGYVSPSTDTSSLSNPYEAYVSPNAVNESLPVEEPVIADTTFDMQHGAVNVVPYANPTGSKWNIVNYIADFFLNEGESKDALEEDIKKRQAKIPLPGPDTSFTPRTSSLGQVIETRAGDNELAYINKKRQVEEAVEKVYRKPLTRAFERGLQEGIAQNIELLTGLDTKLNPLSLTKSDIESLVKDNIISRREANAYEANNFMVGLAEASTAAIVNSVLIAGEIAATAPAATSEALALGKEGVKVLSKEGLKRYGKELLVQGANSYRVMGLGANVKATRETIADLQEAKEKGEDVSVPEFIGLTLGNYFKENFQAWMEGSSEAMLGELRFGSVGVKKLMSFNKQAWKNFGKNLVKKQTLGTIFETATEQATDFTGDLLEGKNLLTQGSTAWNILLGESAEIKKQALMNLLVEGVTGFVLGNAMGVADMFGRKFEAEVDDMVKSGELRKEEAEILKEEAKNPQHGLAIIDNLAEMKKQNNMSPTIKDMNQGLKGIVAFGSQDLVKLTKETKDHNEAVKRVDEDGVNNAVLATQRSIDAAASGIKTSALDNVVEHGRQNFISYLLAAKGKSNSKETRSSLEHAYPVLQLDQQSLHSYTEQIRDTAQLEARKLNLHLEFEKMGGVINGAVRNELLADIYAGIFLGYKDRGWDTVERQYSKADTKVDVKNMIDKAKELQKSIEKTKLTPGIQSINATHDVFFEDLKDEQQVKAYEDLQEEQAKKRQTDELHTNLAEIRQGLEQPDFKRNVAVRDKKTGQIYTAPGKYFHSDVYGDNNLKLDGMTGENYEDGFTDETGKFYTKGQLLGNEQLNFDKKISSISTPFVEGSTLKYNEIIGQFQGKTFNDFLTHLIDKGVIVNQDLSTLVKILAKHVGDYNLTVEALPAKASGRTAAGLFIPFSQDPLNTRIIINSEAFVRTDSQDVAKTLIHEALHALTVDFLNSGLPAANKLKSEIGGIILAVEKVMEYPNRNEKDNAVALGLWTGTLAELEDYKKLYEDEIAYYTRKLPNKQGRRDLNVEEFLAGIFSDTTIMRQILSKMPSSGIISPLSIDRANKFGETKGIIRRIWDAMLGEEAKTKLGNRTMLDVMDQLFWDESIQEGLGKYHKARLELGGGLTQKDLRLYSELISHYSDDLGENDTTVDDEFSELDDNQIDEEAEDLDAYKTRLESKSFTALLVDVTDTLQLGPPGLANHIQSIKEMTSISTFRKHLETLDKASGGMITKRINSIWERHHKNKYTKEEFKDLFTSANFRQTRNGTPRTFIRVQTNYEYDHEHRRDSYTTALIKDGHQDSAKFVRGDTVLDSFLPFLNAICGLKVEDGNLMSIHFVSGFDTLREGNIIDQGRNIKSLSNYNLGLKKNKAPVTDNLSEILSRQREGQPYRYLYMGNFAGKSTLPVLAVPINAWNKVNNVIDQLKNYYNGALNIEQADMKGMSDAMWRSNIMRLILEETFRGTKFVTKEGKLQPDKSRLVGEDLNKIYKRGTTFLTQVERIVVDIEELNKLTKGKELSGIKIEGNDVNVRTAVVDVNDENPINIKLKDGSTKPITLKQLLVNTLNTPYLDGASIYLLDEFDTVYNGVFGNTKEGAIKNFYSSFAGEQPLFIKHAMHGVSRNSAIGKFMVRNGLAILTTKDAAKITPTIKDQNGNEGNIDIIASNFWEPGNKIPDQNILNLKLSKFYFKKNEQNTDFLAGVTKQWFNGSSFVESNPVFQAIGAGPEIVRILNRLTDNARNNALAELKYLAKPENLLDIALQIIASPQGEREQQVRRTFSFLETMNPELLRQEAGNIIAIPSIANALRSRVIEPLVQHLNGKIPGARVALRFNNGFLNEEADIESVTNTKSKVSLLFNTLHDDSELWDVLVPEKEVRDKVFLYRKIGNEESAAHRRRDKVKIKELKAEREALMEEIRTIGGKGFQKANQTEEQMARHKQLHEAKGITGILNTTHPLVNKTLNELIWGKETQDKDGNINYKPGILHRDTGMLQGDWILVDEATASARGWQVGDQIIAVITPTDSPLGIMAVKIGGIIKTGMSNNNTAVFNSELIQTLNGKDFDIDTIALMGYDETYWNHGDFNSLHKRIGEAKEEYIKQVTATVKKVLKDKTVFIEGTNTEIPINRNTVFSSKEVREAYMIALNGPHPRQVDNKRRFKVAGKDFQFVDGAYLVDPSSIISERLKHTALSAIDFRSKVGEKEFNVNHSKWMETHVFHLFDTNFSVDFPGQTSKLVYNSDPKSSEYKDKMFTHFFGEGAKVDELSQKAINDFINWLVQSAFSLVKQRDLQGNSLDYVQTKRMIQQMQSNLSLLGHRGAGRLDALRQLAKNYFAQLDSQLEQVRGKYGNTHRRYIEAKEASDKVKELLGFDGESLDKKGFILSIKVGDITKYPLFRTILNIDTETDMPVPGTSYQDWLIDQANAARDLLKSSAFFNEVWKSQLAVDPKTGKLKSAIEKMLTVPYKVGKYEANSILRMLNIRPNLVKDFGGRDVSEEDKALITKEWVKAFNDSFVDSEKGFITRVNLLLDYPEILEVYKKHKVLEQDRGRFEDAIEEYKAIQSELGRLYPADFMRDGQKQHINSIAILLSIIPRQVDFYFQRRRNVEDKKVIPSDNQLITVRDEAISLITAMEEQPISKVGVAEKGRVKAVAQLPSEGQLYNRYGRQTTFPLLFKAMLEKPRFKTKNQSLYRQSQNSNSVTFITLQMPAKDGKKHQIEFHLSADGRLAFKWMDREGKEQFRYHDVLLQEARKNPESSEARIYKYLTERNGFWEGLTNDSYGYLNRVAFGKMLRFSDNLSYSERIELAKKHIGRRLYADNIFTQFDKEIFWLSVLGQTTNLGLRDNKAQNLIFNKTQWTDERPLNFVGNEIAHELMSYFEPNLFQSFVKLYSDNVSTKDRYSKEIGIRVLQQGPVEETTHLMNGYEQPIFDEESKVQQLLEKTQQPSGLETKTIREVAMLFTDEIDTLQDSISDLRAFKKLVKTSDYKTGVEILKKWIRSLYLEKKLLQYHMPLRGLQQDLNKLSPKEFNEKYKSLNPLEVALDYEKIKGTNMGAAVLRDIFSTPITQELEEGSNIQNLFKAFRKLRRVERSLTWKEKVLGKFTKKSFLNLATAEKLLSFIERKFYALSPNRTSVIGFIFDKKNNLGRGYVNIEHGDVAATRALVPTWEWNAFGESSVAFMKSRAIETTLNLLKKALLTHIDNAETYVELLTDIKSADKYLADHSFPTDDPQVLFIKNLISKLETNAELPDMFAERKKLFELAENLSKSNKFGGEGLMWTIPDPHRPEQATIYDSFANKHYGSILDVIKHKYYNYPAWRQLEIMAALTMRKMYDVEVPSIIHKGRNYIYKSKQQAQDMGDIGATQELQALAERYEQYVDAIKANFGHYMPHQYPIGDFKLYHYKLYVDEVKATLTAQILHNQRLKKKDPTGDYDRQLADIHLGKSDKSSPTGKGQEAFEKLVQQRLENKFDEENVGNPSSYMISNFLSRRVSEDENYIKTSNKVHYDYNMKLIDALRNDMKYADWLVYRATARANGERSSVIEMMQQWYGDQIQNKMLHVSPVDVKKLKRGMQINFTTKGVSIDRLKKTPYTTELEIWGTVDKIDEANGEIHLHVDKEATEYKLKTSLAKIAKLKEKLEKSAFYGINIDEVEYDVLEKNDRLADEFDLGVLRNLLQRGFLTKEEITSKQKRKKVGPKVLTVIERTDSLMLSELGIRRQLKDISRLGIYKISDIWTKDASGKRTNTQVNRYRRRGSLEYLDTKARELHNIKEMDGEWKGIDALQYGFYKVTGFGSTYVNKAYKTIASLVYLGLVNAPRAYIQNKGGAILSNILDAPIHNGLKWLHAGGLYKRLSSVTPSQVQKLSPAELEWHNRLTSLGLLEKNTLTSVVLSSANLDSIDMLEGRSDVDKYRYLVRALVQGIGIKQHLKELKEVRQEILMNTDPEKEYPLLLKYIEINNKFKTKVESKPFKKTKSGFSRLSANVGDQLTAFQAAKMIGSLTWRKFVRGNLGLGLQAKGEKERIKAFIIGFETAKENGHGDEEAIHYGFNSIMFRHAYYSSEYKSFGANTKLGSSLYQFAQYQNNSWLSTGKLLYDGWGQISAAMANAHGNNPVTEFWAKFQVPFKRTLDVLDANSKAIPNPNNKRKTMQSTNMIRAVGIRLTCATIMATLGTKVIWGLPNMLDPIAQTLYRFMELFAGALWETNDDDSEQLRRMMLDLMFMVGVPYKLMGTLGMMEEDETTSELMTRGRFQQQLDFFFRLDNSLKALYDAEALEYDDKTLAQMSYMLDSFTGIKFYGYSSGEPDGYEKTSYFITSPWSIEKQTRPVKPMYNRYIPHEDLFGNYDDVNTIKQGERYLKMLDPYTYLPPILDNLIYGQ